MPAEGIEVSVMVMVMVGSSFLVVGLVEGCYSTRCLGFSLLFTFPDTPSSPSKQVRIRPEHKTD